MTPPGKPLPTSVRGQRTRRALLDAAREVFAKEGFSRPSVGAITDAAGVSHGSFYVYFASKQDLLATIARELGDEVNAATRAPVTETDLNKRLDFELDRFFESYREHAAVYQLIDEAVRTDAEFRALWSTHRRLSYGRLTHSLRHLKEAGLTDPELEPEAAAVVLGAMAERVAYLCTVDDNLDVPTVRHTLSVLWGNAVGMRQPADAVPTAG